MTTPAIQHKPAKDKQASLLEIQSRHLLAIRILLTIIVALMILAALFGIIEVIAIQHALRTLVGNSTSSVPCILSNTCP